MQADGSRQVENLSAYLDENILEASMRRLCATIQRCPKERYLHCPAFNADRNCWQVAGIPCCRRNIKSRCLNCDVYVASASRGQDIYSQNKGNLAALIKLYSRRTMASFIGAGTSKPLGISDWGTLMHSLFDKAKRNGFGGNFPVEPKQWPQLAQEIFDHLNGQGLLDDVYFGTISKRMRPRNNTTTLTLVKLVLALDVHLTTNFDSSVEKAYEFLDYLSRYFERGELRKEYKWNYLPDFESHMTEASGGLIYYLHGNADQNVYILKTSDYDTFYPSISGSESCRDSLETFLKNCYKNYNIVFLGFSFSDYYVREFFFKLAKEIERENRITSEFFRQSGQRYVGKDVKHFLITDADILYEYGGNVYEFFQEFNIYPIIYRSEEHMFLERLFEGLGQNILL